MRSHDIRRMRRTKSAVRALRHRASASMAPRRRVIPHERIPVHKRLST